MRHKIKTQKALRDEGYGHFSSRCHLPSQIGIWGIVVTVLVHLELERTHLMAINVVFLRRIFSHIHILLNIKLHIYLSLLYS